MGDAGGELAERSKLLGLHQAVLGGAQILQRSCEFPGAGLDILEQPGILDRDRRLGRERLDQINGISGKAPGIRRRTTRRPTMSSPRNSGATNRAR